MSNLTPFLFSNLALIGYRAVGKTTLGKILAQKYQVPFIDLDEELEKILGPISLFWKHYGESEFRLQETQLLEKLLPSLQQTLLACGGGTPLLFRNRELLKQWGRIVWLKRSPEQILQHLKQQPTRPALTQQSLEEEVRSLLAIRTPLYEACADISVELLGNSLEEDLHSLAQRIKPLNELNIPKGLTLEDAQVFDRVE